MVKYKRTIHSVDKSQCLPLAMPNESMNKVVIAVEMEVTHDFNIISLHSVLLT